MWVLALIIAFVAGAAVGVLGDEMAHTIVNLWSDAFDHLLFEDTGDSWF